MSLAPDPADSPRQVRIAPKPGGYVVEVDGVDVAPMISGFTVAAFNPRELPEVTLISRRPVDVALAATVTVRTQDVPEFGDLLADFLRQVDPVDLERVALMRDDLQPTRGGGTAAILRQLAEWARAGA